MDRFELQKLRDLPIEGVAERLGLQVTHHKCLCPFHDDHHASLSFSISRNTYRCFVCGASGGTIDLVMRCLNKDFLDACRWLADAHNVILSDEGSRFQGENSKPSNLNANPFDATRYGRFFERPWLSAAARRFLFGERRLDERVVRWCRLTSWTDRHGVDWLQIPYFSREGELIGLQNRNLTEGALPRFRFPTGSQCGIYNLPVLNRGAVDHRGLFRLLGHALGGPQGHSHPVGHAAEAQRFGTIVNSPFSIVNCFPHVPRPRRAWRTALPPAAGGAAHAHAPSASPWLQGL